MKNKSVLILFFTLAICLCACLQDNNSESIPIRYTVFVHDGVNGDAIKGANVELTFENLVKHSLLTDANGKAVFPAKESLVNQIIVSKDGYITADTIDVISVTDSTLESLLRVVNMILMPKNNPITDTNRIDSLK